MRRLLLAALLSALATSASATSFDFTAAINAAQVVPPTTSVAFGTGVFSFDDVTNLLSVSIVQTNKLLTGTETQAQIHGPAAVGANAAAIADLPLGSLKLASLDLSLLAACAGGALAGCIADLKAGLWYTLTNTAPPGFPDGEIRGQIVPVTVRVPEAAKWLMMVLGLTGLAAYRREMWVEAT